jgi:hypothetical protein
MAVDRFHCIITFPAARSHNVSVRYSH